MRKTKLLILIVASLVAGHARATSCNASAPSGVTPAPEINPQKHALLSHTERIIIDAPVEYFREWFLSAPLEDLLPGTRDIPAVTGTAGIGSPSFPAPSAMRYVCLKDGSAAIEKVLSNEPGSFSYVVWGYTLPSAQALKYGHGRFEFGALGDRTELRWTYAFHLKEDQMPGRLGSLGRLLFRISFLDRQYAEFMRSGMRAIKNGAEASAKAGVSS